MNNMEVIKVEKIAEGLAQLFAPVSTGKPVETADVNNMTAKEMCEYRTGIEMEMDSSPECKFIEEHLQECYGVFGHDSQTP